MKQPFVFGGALFASLVVPPLAHATDYYFGPSGSASAACTQAAPCALNYNMSGKTLKGGDTVYLLGGTYSGQYIRSSVSGTASAWLTFKAVDGQLPILKGTGASGCGVEPSAAVQYVRFEGIASTNWGSSGFSNGWNSPASKIEIINCIADGNGINGIAFYKATGVLIKQSIVAHNGNKDPSWSSGVNLFTAGGTYADNIVDSNVSFENVDISSHKSDGSGFILDENSTGATFVNNLGFRNGGSCIRLTNSPNSHIINNTCVGDGIDANVSYHQEVFYSQATCHPGAVLRNNVLVASAGNTALQGTPATMANNVTVNGGGSAPFFVSNSGELDFHLVSGATTLINQGATTEAPTTDIGFDPKCVKAGNPGGASFWTYEIDYTYIASVGGIKGCFKPSARAGNPDLGAYEFGGVAAGGATSTGGTSTMGGTSAVGGTSSTGGSSSLGGTHAGGTNAGGVSTGATSAKGGASSVSTTAKGGSTSGAPITTAASTGGASNVGGTSGTVVAGGGGATQVTTVAAGGAIVLGTGGTTGLGTLVAQAGATAPTGGALGALGGSASAGSTTPEGSDDGGCSCRIAAKSSTNTGWIVWLGLALLGLKRKRTKA